MKKIIFILLLLLITINGFAQKSSSSNVFSLSKIFALDGSDITVELTKDKITLIKDEPISEFELSYELGYIFGTLDNYFTINNINIKKSGIKSITFIYKDNRNKILEMTWTTNEIIDILIDNISEQADYIQQELIP